MAARRLRIATFNVNSIRSRLPIVTGWIGRHRPDVLCMQETKVVDELFPVEPFERLGYRVAFRGQKSYNGVAVATREEPQGVVFGLDVGSPPDEPRFMSVAIHGVTVVNTYVPQGREVGTESYAYKLEWLERLRAWLERAIGPRARLVWCGDINVAPAAIDVHDPRRLEGHVCFNPEVRGALARIRDLGLVDVFRKHHPEPGHYTFFDYRVRGSVERGLGWRVDHIHATGALARTSRDAWIDLDPRRAERPSDHAPLVVDFGP
jgi:exodeoxyribonuclease-3